MQLLTLFSNLFNDDSNQKASRFVSTGDTPIKNHIRLGSLLEILGIGPFETRGGDDPKLFIRINDPNMVKKDASDKSYTNIILESVKRRHKVSCQIFEHFFTHYFNNETRWNFIEDFFLGYSYNELMEKYEGAIRNNVNIIEYLKKNALSKKSAITTKSLLKDSIHKFDIRVNGFYYADNLLTIDKKTFSIRSWLSEDPVLLHRTMIKHNINIDKNCYKVLISKLQSLHFPYYRDFMGLHLLIDFPGYEDKVMASVPYTDKPIQFYKWWKKDESLVTLSYAQQINLFLIVNDLNPNVLLKKHRLKIEK